MFEKINAKFSYTLPTIARARYVTFLIVLGNKVIVKNATFLENHAEVQLRCLDTIGQMFYYSDLQVRESSLFISYTAQRFCQLLEIVFINWNSACKIWLLHERLKLKLSAINVSDIYKKNEITKIHEMIKTKIKYFKITYFYKYYNGA